MMMPHRQLTNNQDLWEWIVNNLNDPINRAKNENPMIQKFIDFHPYENNPNISLSNNDQELLDKLILPDFMEQAKSKSPTQPSNPRESSINYKKPTVDIRSIEIKGS
jgi:hypothetical protein